MKFVLAILLILQVIPLFAQEEKRPTNVFSNSEKTILDSMANRKLDTVDSLTSKVNTIHNIDSEVLTLNDSLKLKSNQKLYSIQNRLTPRIDSLKSLQISDQKFRMKINHLAHSEDSLKKISEFKDLKNVQERLSQTQSQANGKLKEVENKINTQLKPLAEDGANVSNVKLPELNLPGTNGLIPDMKIGSIDLSKQNVQGSASILNGQSVNLIPNTTDVSDLSQVKVNAIKNSELTQKVESYQTDIERITDLDKVKALPGQAESSIENLDQVKDLQGQFAEADKLKRYYDPEVAKEELLNKAKGEAVNHFAGHEKELQIALDQFSKIRSKVPDPDGVYDMIRKHTNALKGRPFKERLVPGVVFQFQKPNESLWLDINPIVGYRISGRFLFGLSWNERLSYGTDNHSFNKFERISGPRSYILFKFKSNTWLKTEAETMAAWKRNIQDDRFSKEWIWNYFAGIKKDFKFSNRLFGNMQMLYNVYNPNKQSPYNSRFTIRFGFDLPIGKKIIE